VRRRRVYVQCDVVVKHRQGQARKSGARLSKEIVGQSIASQAIMRISAPHGGQRNGRGRVRGPLQKRSEPLAALDMAPLRVRALRSRPVSGDFEMSTVLTHPEITPRRLDCLAGLRGFELRNPCARLQSPMEIIPSLYCLRALLSRAGVAAFFQPKVRPDRVRRSEVTVRTTAFISNSRSPFRMGKSPRRSCIAADR
jgi:hypothetical protein